MEQLIILGAGTMAMEITELVNESYYYSVIAYAVNRDWQPGQMLNNLPVLWVDDLKQWAGHAKAVRAIFSPDCRNFIETVETMGFEFATVVAASASVSPTAQLAPGVTINRLTAVGCKAVIGKHTLINRGCLIGHHTQIGEFCTLGPGVNIAGNARIGNNVFIGMGATILPGAVIGDNETIRGSSKRY